MNNIFIPNDVFVLVSQGIAIDWFYDRDAALIVAQKLNNDYFEYRQRCLDRNEAYADNRVFVYHHGEMIANEWGLLRQPPM